ncbi:hypothetical protein [Polymorphospora lycopeni]|uniref:hypothetical protein n=1 Tax=Polymorphospora lycopeni TaxID=3140240 RepID=UPI004062D4FA
MLSPNRHSDRARSISAGPGGSTEEPDANGWLRLEVTLQDLRHAEWALWQLGVRAEALPRSRCVPPCAAAPVRRTLRRDMLRVVAW